jgi:hypothetical protein
MKEEILEESQKAETKWIPESDREIIGGERKHTGGTIDNHGCRKRFCQSMEHGEDTLMDKSISMQWNCN